MKILPNVKLPYENSSGWYQDISDFINEENEEMAGICKDYGEAGPDEWITLSLVFVECDVEEDCTGKETYDKGEHCDTYINDIHYLNIRSNKS